MSRQRASKHRHKTGRNGKTSTAATPSTWSPSFPTLLVGQHEADRVKRAMYVGRNYERADLRGKDLQGVNFTCGHFRGATLDGADLRGADFTNCDLSRASLHNVN